MLGHKQGDGGDCIHLSRASLAVRFLGHEKKRLSHFIRSTWNNYCVQCGDVAGNTNSAVLFDIFIAEHLFTSSCVRVFWTCPENGTFGWLVSHTEWRLIEIIWLCLWSRIGGGGQACNFIELHRPLRFIGLYMLCTILHFIGLYWALHGYMLCSAVQCFDLLHHIAQLLLARMLLNKTNVLQSFWGMTFCCWFTFKRFIFLTLCSDASVAKILQRCCLHVAPVWQEYHRDVSRRIELAIVASGSFWLPLTWSPPWNFSSRSNIIFILTLINDCPHPQKLHNTISSN